MIRYIAPSLLSADFNNLGRDIEMVNQSEADWFHLDIMDGVFVPNMSYGFPVVEHITKLAKKPLDVHLIRNYNVQFHNRSPFDEKLNDN